MVRARLVIVVLTCLMSGLVAACGNLRPARTSEVATSAAAPPSVESGPSYEVLVQGDFADPSMPRITAEDLKSLTDRGVKIIIIDSRNEYKFNKAISPVRFTSRLSANTVGPIYVY